MLIRSFYSKSVFFVFVFWGTFAGASSKVAVRTEEHNSFFTASVWVVPLGVVCFFLMGLITYKEMKSRRLRKLRDSFVDDVSISSVEVNAEDVLDSGFVSLIEYPPDW